MLLLPSNLVSLLLLLGSLSGCRVWEAAYDALTALEASDTDVDRRAAIRPTLPDEYLVLLRSFPTPEEEAKIKAKGDYPLHLEYPIRVRLNTKTEMSDVAHETFQVVPVKKEQDSTNRHDARPTVTIEEGTSFAVALNRVGDEMFLDATLTAQQANGAEDLKIGAMAPKPGETNHTKRVKFVGHTYRIVESIDIGGTISGEFDGWILEAKLVGLASEADAAEAARQTAVQPADTNELQR